MIERDMGAVGQTQAQQPGTSAWTEQRTHLFMQLLEHSPLLQPLRRVLDQLRHQHHIARKALDRLDQEELEVGT